MAKQTTQQKILQKQRETGAPPGTWDFSSYDATPTPETGVGGGVGGGVEVGTPLEVIPTYQRPPSADPLMKKWEGMFTKASTPDPKITQRWEELYGKAELSPQQIWDYASKLRAIEEPLYAQEAQALRTGLENRLLQQGMLGSTGGGLRAGALESSLAQAEQARQAERIGRSTQLQQQNLQNLMGTLSGGQAYAQSGFANMLNALKGSSGFLTGLEQIATSRGLGEAGIPLSWYNALNPQYSYPYS